MKPNSPYCAKRIEERASSVAVNRSVPIECLLVSIVSQVPMVPNVLNGLNGWNDLNPTHMRLAPRSRVCSTFFPRRMNNQAIRFAAGVFHFARHSTISNDCYA
jgi:hypothetical protein